MYPERVHAPTRGGSRGAAGRDSSGDPAAMGSVGLLALGRQRAAELLEKARVDADEVRRQAREEGYRDGLEQGRQEMHAQLEVGLKRLEEEGRTRAASFASALDQVRQLADARREPYRDQVQASLLELALRICRRMVKRELTQDPSALVPSIRRALQELHVHQPAVIRVHPSDFENKEAFEDLSTSGAPFRLEADERVGLGGFLIESEAGTVDGRMDTRLEFIRRQLLDGD